MEDRRGVSKRAVPNPPLAAMPSASMGTQIVAVIRSHDLAFSRNRGKGFLHRLEQRCDQGGLKFAGSVCAARRGSRCGQFRSRG